MSRPKAFDLPGHEVRKVLRDVPNQGRTVLLTHFGGLKGVRQAGEAELSSVPGISMQLAKRIFAALH